RKVLLLLFYAARNAPETRYWVLIKAALSATENVKLNSSNLVGVLQLRQVAWAEFCGHWGNGTLSLSCSTKCKAMRRIVGWWLTHNEYNSDKQRNNNDRFNQSRA